MTSLIRRGQTSRDLYSAIFEADSPEQFVRTVPAQSLYLAIKVRGIESSVELLEVATIEQTRLLLDFDLWEKDNFKEENVWQWLSLTDDEDPLKFTQKFLKAIDLKLIAILIAKYVQLKVFDEPTENPPGAGWSTPDKGHTWLHVVAEDSDKFFLLNRLLALIFETSAELFYQLLSVPSVSTISVLEDESFIDRSKRLAAEGVPEPSMLQEINASLFPYEAKQLLSEGKEHAVVTDVPIIEPLLYDNRLSLEPLTSALSQVHDKETVEGELSLLINASIEFYGVPLYDYELVMKHVERVRGAINIGLEKALSLIEGVTATEALTSLGLTKLYRLGLFELRALRKEGLKYSMDEVKAISEDPKNFSVIAHLRQEFPEMPLCLVEPTDDQKKFEDEAQPFQHLYEIEQAIDALVSCRQSYPAKSKI